MKSPMVQNASYIPDKSGYTDLRVLRSAAGWYVGTLYENRNEKGELLFLEPGSRDSDYFATEEAATAFLKAVENTDEETAALVMRQHP
jgi:hypothetical protein